MPRSPILRRPLVVTLLLAVFAALLAAVLVRLGTEERVHLSPSASEQGSPSADLAPAPAAAGQSAGSSASSSSASSPSATTAASTPSAAAVVDVQSVASPSASATASATTGDSADLDDAAQAGADPGLTGAPPAAGLSAKPLRVVAISSSAGLVAAISAARPGDRLQLAAGTYRGPFGIESSGTADHPVVIAPAKGAAVTLTASLPSPSCRATGPDTDRTIRFNRGASHWVVYGMSIVGGVVISGDNADVSQNWQAQRINNHDWQARRAVPGSSSRNPISARSAVSYLSNQSGQTLKASDDIRIVRNTITGKGIFGRLSRYGVLGGNTVTNIACGTGPGIWLANFSSGWTIRNNDVSKVADNATIHYMQEGIRIGNGSNYNVLVSNNVHDLPTDSRAITTDQDSSWNVITRNQVSNVELGYNEQQAAWGNTWSYNVATNVRGAGFSFRMEDIRLKTPSMDTSSRLAVVSCNRVVGAAKGSSRSMQAGAMSGATFSGNTFSDPYVGKALAGYWGQQGNRWNGKATPPTDASSASAAAGC